MAREFAEKEWWGSTGELLAAATEPMPQRTAASYPAPNWEREEQERREREGDSVPPPQPPCAPPIATLMAGEWDPGPVGPIVVDTPLRRFVPPKPDWRLEEKQRAERLEAERTREAQLALEAPAPPPQPDYPARRKRWLW